MKFDQPATTNPIDQMKVVGRPVDRIDGKLKTTGHAPYAYERHDVIANQAYGFVIGAAIAKGRIDSVDIANARRAPGVLGIVTTLDMPPLPKGRQNYATLFGGAEVAHYHQAIAIVVAETFEQARAAATLVRVEYTRADKGRFDLEAQASTAKAPTGRGAGSIVGDFNSAFAAAEVKLDAHYSTPDESHAMMEPHATIAAWSGGKVTLWTSNQMIAWSQGSLATILGIPPENIRLDSPYIGGGFGGKLFLRSDAICAAIAAKAVGRPVKIALTRPIMANNTTHRPATHQRIRIGCLRSGQITAIAHENLSGNLAGGSPENAIQQTQYLYAGANRLLVNKLAELDLPEGNAMRAPGEASGLMALEVAMDEMAEKLGIDPVTFRILNDTQVVPAMPSKRFSQRQLVECLRQGADHFGWSKRNAKPGSTREGEWLIGMGVAAGFRNAPVAKSAARVRLSGSGSIIVETDMTDIGTGTYTILAQTAAEMMGVPIDRIDIRLGDSDFPESAGSGGQWGAASSTAGVYAACIRLREIVAEKFGFMSKDIEFANGMVRADGRAPRLEDAASDGEIVVTEQMEYGGLSQQYQQSTFAGHFVEVAVNGFTGETRVRRMLAVCAAGRILNPKAARSQIIGAMTMGVGGALMEELAVDSRFGLFINHDLAGYEVPVHADIPHQEVIFLDETDATSSPMKAKGVGELGLCGVSAAIANAIYNATGVRVRNYPITLDKYLDQLPPIAA